MRSARRWAECETGIGFPKVLAKLRSYRLDTRKKAVQIQVTTVSTSFSADPVLKQNTTQSSWYRWRRRKAYRIRQGSDGKEFDNQRFTVRLNTDSNGNERSDRDIATTERYLLIKIKIQLSVATTTCRSVRNIVRISVESSDEHGRISDRE